MSNSTKYAGSHLVISVYRSLRVVHNYFVVSTLVLVWCFFLYKGFLESGLEFLNPLHSGSCSIYMFSSSFAEFPVIRKLNAFTLMAISHSSRFNNPTPPHSGFIIVSTSLLLFH